MQPVGNATRVSAPRKGGNAAPLEGSPWGPGSRHLRRSGRKGREGQEGGRCFFQGPAGENPGGAEAQESNGSAPVVTMTGGLDARLASRAQAAEASMPSRRVWQENVGADRSRETASGPEGRKKALKSEAQERGKLKDASEDRGADTAERVAKPWGWGFWKAWHGLSNVRFRPDEKKGSPVSTC
jgi:hypothetical protein